ncbi:hypothetical protein ACF0H5_000574 [Mactra antiquata]
MCTTVNVHDFNIKMRIFRGVLVLITAVHAQWTLSCSAERVDPEVYMNTTQLIRSKGYICEEHQVHTRDGYILDIQRIPPSRGTGSGKVVLLQHGLLSCSACWVENLVNESLGFMLADRGFDVWLGNSRGNTYGRKHEKLNPNEDEFWDFSWDEMADIDIPNTIDYILKQSGQTKISYVGHSQGTEVLFAALSENEELADKVELFIALAPAVYMGHLKSPVRLLSGIPSDLAYAVLGRKDFAPETEFITWLAADVCGKEIPGILCENVLFILGGYDYKEMNASRIPVYVGQHPAGTSVKNILHYAQAVQSDKFQRFDYGPKMNMEKYNQTTPPEFYLKNVKTPTVVYSGTADWLVVPEDANRTVSELPNVVEHIVIDGWEHLDFIWALHAPSKCYNHVVELLENNK